MCVHLFQAELQPYKRAILILINVHPLISIALKQKVGLPLYCWKVLEQGIKGTQGELLPDSRNNVPQKEPLNKHT